MDLAAAVNEEMRDLFAAGADIVQIDEPWLQSRAEKAREFALPAIDRALRDLPGTTALHTCFGYAAVVHDKPRRLPVPRRARATARPTCSRSRPPSRGLDPAMLEPIAHKTVIVGVLDLSTDAGRDARAGGRADRGGADRRPRRAAAGRPRLRDEVPPARRWRSRSCARWSRARGSCATGSRRARGRARSVTAPSSTSARTRASTSRMTCTRSSVSARNGWKSRARNRRRARPRARRAPSRAGAPAAAARVPSAPRMAAKCGQVVEGVEQRPAERQRGQPPVATPRRASSR